MRYYVLWPDGRRFGPADVNTLKLWAVENRIGPATVLVEESTGRQIAATSLPELSPLLLQPFAAPPDWSRYRGAGGGAYPHSGNTEFALAWVFGAIGLCFCPIAFSTVGIVFAAIAMGKKHPSAWLAMVFCCITLVVGTLLGGILSALVALP